MEVANIVITYNATLKLLLCLCLTANYTFAQTKVKPDSEAYRKAVKYLENRDIDSIMHLCGVDENIARAVVFPEVLRYNALCNIIETTMIQALYVQFGKQYADFSIGVFQMKPSFVEALERELFRTGNRHFFNISANLSQSKYARRARAVQLNSEKGQIFYLALFMITVRSRFPELETMTAHQQVRFYATAYNYSYNASYASIMRKQRFKEYHQDVLQTSKTVLYNYADVAEEYYNKLMQYSSN